MRAISLVTLAVLAASTLYGAEVYRYVDENGNVGYSDRPVGQNPEPIVVTTYTPIVPSAPTPTPAAAQPDPETADETVRREPTPEERAQDRAANCTIARERFQRYAISRRLFRELPDGEREYLSDAEIDEARAGAAADVEEWCD
ncbi:MAG: DUF4124 domain-containing protein [Gammaproteobacteria bacterium]|nr:DUF4124 domain-containing protein [Gammaproteobacteria bacterium]